MVNFFWRKDGEGGGEEGEDDLFEGMEDLEGDDEGKSSADVVTPREFSKHASPAAALITPREFSRLPVAPSPCVHGECSVIS